MTFITYLAQDNNIVLDKRIEIEAGHEAAARQAG